MVDFYQTEACDLCCVDHSFFCTCRCMRLLSSCCQKQEPERHMDRGCTGEFSATADVVQVCYIYVLVRSHSVITRLWRLPCREQRGNDF